MPLEYFLSYSFVTFASMNITIEKLSIGYKKEAPVIENINMKIESGQLTCLIGKNGVGKSTLLKTLTGFLPKLSGHLLIDNSDIETMSQQERSKAIGIVLTLKTDIQNFKMKEMVAMGRTPYTDFWGKLNDEDNLIVDNAIQLVGIEHLRGRMIQTLSDGERQKVMIAKALAQETPIILLDEPTAFLDFQSKVEMMILLKRLAHETNKIIFLSTHDLEIAIKIADTLVELTSDGLAVVEASRVQKEIEKLFL